MLGFSKHWCTMAQAQCLVMAHETTHWLFIPSVNQNKPTNRNKVIQSHKRYASYDEISTFSATRNHLKMKSFSTVNNNLICSILIHTSNVTGCHRGPKWKPRAGYRAP